MKLVARKPSVMLSPKASTVGVFVIAIGSMTLTKNVQREPSLARSVRVQTTSVSPTGKRVPGPGAQAAAAGAPPTVLDGTSKSTTTRQPRGDVTAIEPGQANNGICLVGSGGGGISSGSGNGPGSRVRVRQRLRSRIGNFRWLEVRVRKLHRPGRGRRPRSGHLCRAGRGAAIAAAKVQHEGQRHQPSTSRQSARHTVSAPRWTLTLYETGFGQLAHPA